MSQYVKEFSTADDRETLKRLNGFVVIDFYADWCGPCQAFAPAFESVAEELGGNLTFAKANVDKAAKMAQEFQVRSIPTLVILKDGQEIARSTGAMSATNLRESLESLVKQGEDLTHSHGACGCG